MEILMRDFGGLIVFLHVLSAVIWVGGMIAIRLAVHTSLIHIPDPQMRIARTLEIMEKFFRIVMPFAVTIFLTALLLIVGLGLEGGSVRAKEIIWTVMFFNFVGMIIIRNRAQIAFIEGKTKEAGLKLIPIGKYMIPVNIALGIIAIYLGVGLRGF
ncbi:MAG: hypothetical protein OIF32_04840 [Campylobacterales bacterium]|nr:hypothetical protein [Campylobacterales bacterium]